MLIHITPDELEPEFRNNWRMGFISQPSIDYADNAVYAVFEGKQVIIFYFKKYDINNNGLYDYAYAL